MQQPRHHTPGPWRIACDYGAIVADRRVKGDHETDAASAAAYGHALGGALVCESVRRHNARLIAAAPELLDAIERLVLIAMRSSWALLGPERHAAERAIEAAEIAIARATGEHLSLAMAERRKTRRAIEAESAL